MEVMALGSDASGYSGTTVGADGDTISPHLRFIGLPFTTSTMAPPALLLLDLCNMMLSDVRVDEAFYFERYPDVAHAVRAGRCGSAKDHYLKTGFFEGRQPFLITVDRQFYLDTNPDVKAGVAIGNFESAQTHFDMAGWKEGRSPSAEFSLLP
jgi:hypothetical protein